MRRRQRESCVRDIHPDEFKRLWERFPAKVWVNHLLLHMWRNSISSFTLQRSKGIPAMAWEGHLPPGGFDFDKIINRLKVLSGLDPVTFKQPRDGKTTLLINGTPCSVSATFVDSDADSLCTINMHPEKSQ